MNSKWGECDKIAKILGISKQDVYYKLYSDLIAHNLLFALLANNKGAIEKVMELDSYKKIVEHRAPVHTKSEKLKIALWFIDKIGSVDEAIKAVQLAGDAKEKL